MGHKSSELRRAILAFDTPTLRDLSIKGQEKKKTKKSVRLTRLVRESEQMMREANEHICPVSD